MEKARCSVDEICGDTVSTLPHINPYKSAEFDNQIDDIFKRHGASDFKRLIISEKTPQLLIDLGLDGANVVVNKSVITRHITKYEHLESAEEWIALSNNLDKPIAFKVMQNGTIRVYYKSRKKRPIVVVIKKQQTGRFSYSNIIITAFYRTKDYQKELESGQITKINQPSVRRHQLPSVLSSSVGSN